MNDLHYQVYDDVLGPNVWQQLQNACLDKSQPWYFGGTAYESKTDNETCSFSMIPDVGTPMEIILSDSILNCLDNTYTVCNNLIRIRLGLITKQNESTSFTNEAHVDDKMPHMVGLFYLNESDGDTIIYNQTTDDYPEYDLSKEFYNSHLKDNLTEMVRVTPKPNRLIIFDGKHFHASSTPTTTSRRIVLNFNFA
jgi:hypothetical protein